MPVNGDFIIFEVASDTFEFSWHVDEARFETLQGVSALCPGTSRFLKTGRTGGAVGHRGFQKHLTQQPGFFRPLEPALDNGRRLSPTAADDGKRLRRRGQSFYSLDSSRSIA